MNADRRLRLIGGCLVGAALLAGAFFLGVATGNFLPLDREGFPAILPELQSIGAPTAPASPDSTPGSSAAPDRETLFEPFWQAWDIVHDQYVDQPVDDVKIMRGAIQGMLDALGDEHTFYMDPSEYEQASFPLEGDYEGIGAWVDTSTEFLTIISPMPGSPAERAGLKPGDEILAVDDEDMTGVDANLVVRSVLGPAGTVVRLTVRREGENEPLELAVTREKIIVPSVESRMLEDDVAYVRLLTFGEDTTGDLQSALDDLLDQEPVGLVLDLRANGGGYLHTAVEVASEFIGEGTILIERFGDGTEQLYEAEPGGRALDIPLVVLIDGGTASASEIVAGAVQDRERGLLVGETSFGKGSVQVWLPLRGDGGAVRITTARWYTPLDRLIHGVGLTPDFVVEPPANGAADEDPALDKAVEILTAAP
ncbi:MAG: S41 family peptidase [Anaerolineales bacterium]